MSGWHSAPVDFLRRRVPSDSVIRPYAKRVVEDLRSMTRVGRPWAHLESARPRALSLETTNICNADCVFCGYQYQSQFRAGQGVMTAELFEKALGDFKAMNGRTIDFTPLVGDPLVDPEIAHRIGRAKQEGFRVILYTNGILFNRIDLDQFLAAGPDVVLISTAPFDRLSHERIYRTRKYNELLDGVERLLELRNKRDARVEIGIEFRAQIPLAKILEQPDFTRRIRPHLRPSELGRIYAQVKSFDRWGGLIEQRDLPAGMRLAVPPSLKFRPCKWTFALMVMYDGRVRACSCRFTGTERGDGRDGLLVGDLLSSSLDEIWRGPEIRRLHRTFQAGTMPRVCRDCTMYRAV